MGEAKRKKLAQAQYQNQVLTAVEKVGHALRRLATAASSHLGSDCYLHAELGRRLLGDLGIEARCVVGYAAWRVGPGDGDVISHTNAVKGYLPSGTQGFAYHAWLDVSGYVVDFTTYQLTRKAAELDKSDGGVTNVEWCPALLFLRKQDVRSYQQVAQLHAGLSHYEEVPEMASILRDGFELDEQDLAAARLILSKPDVMVFGPHGVAGD
jgi:hypothetical protein